MELVRHGHACFSVKDHLNRIWLFDPYRPAGLNGLFNLPLPDLTPTAILSTHSHEDHAWRSADWFHLPFHERPFEAEDIKMSCVTIAHDCDGGTQMGFSRAMRLDIQHRPGQELSVVHAGDASDVETPSLQELCQDADVLILPAGGTYTMGPEQALELAQRSGARCTILTHFREPGVDLPMLRPEEAFDRIAPKVHTIESGRLALPLETEVPPLVWLKAQMSPDNIGTEA